MKHLTLTILVIFISNFCYTQLNSVRRDDSLIVNLCRTFYLSNDLEQHKRNLNISLNYDYQNQYPYYDISSQQIGKNNEIKVSLSHIPNQGFIYIFSEDDMNNFKSLKIIRCDSTKDAILISVFPKIEKLEYINLWYSDVELKDFNNLLKSLQYTMGDFIKRTVYFLDEKLIMPNRFWNFKEHFVGIIFENNIKNKKFVLPIIIKLK